MVFRSRKVGDFPRKASIYLADDNKEKEETDFPFGNTIILLAFFGAVPCLIDRPHRPSMDLKKSTFLYSIIIWFVVYIFAIVSAVEIKYEYDAISPEENILRSIKVQYAFAMVFNALGLFLWLDSDKIAKTLDAFTKIEVNYRKATGSKLQNYRKSLENMAITVTVTVPIAFVGFCWSMIPILKIQPIMALPILYGNVVTLSLSIFVLGLVMRITDAAEDLKQDFCQHVKNGDLNPTLVFNYRIVWLSFRGALNALAQVQSSYIAYTLSIVMASISLYESITLCIAGHILVVFGQCLTASFYIIVLYVCCRICEHAQVKLKSLIAEVFSEIKLSSYDTGTQREIFMIFLVESPRPAIASFEGYITVNKNLFLSVLSTILTYIIVFVQLFKETPVNIENQVE